MSVLIDFFLGPFHVLLPKVFSWIILALAIYSYSGDLTLEEGKGWRRVFRLRNLIIATIAFYGVYAALLTAGQYYLWTQNNLGKILLESPLAYNDLIPTLLERFLSLFGEKRAYFAFYAYSRFWLGALISIGMAFLFYGFLRSLKKYQERFFYEGETELGFLLALLVGWPKFILFLGILFVSVVLVSIIRLVVFKQVYSTLGEPFILSTIILLLWGDRLISLFRLGVFKI